jgi:hypothetical protein
MIIKYNMLSTITSAQFKSDILGLISGTITTVGGLSAGCDTARTTITGTYPTGTYAVVNSGTSTFSKVHSIDNTTTDYFRLNFGTSVLTSIALAQSYTSGTDTLINSVVSPLNLVPNTYSYGGQFDSGITIVITSKCLHITSLYSGVGFGIFDIGTNGITATYNQSMKMAAINTNAGTFTIPYSYRLNGSASGYTSITGSLVSPITPVVAVGPSGSVLPENPVFLASPQQGNITYGVLNLLRIPLGFPDFQYNTSGVTRQTGPGYAIVTE